MRLRIRQSDRGIARLLDGVLQFGGQRVQGILLSRIGSPRQLWAYWVDPALPGGKKHSRPGFERFVRNQTLGLACDEIEPVFEVLVTSVA